MLGFGTVAKSYPFEMPSALTSVGYSTTVIGKDHFVSVPFAPVLQIYCTAYLHLPGMAHVCFCMNLTLQR